MFRFLATAVLLVIATQTANSAALQASQLRWAYNGSGPSILGQSGDWHGWLYEVEVISGGINVALNPARSGLPSPTPSSPGWGGGADTWDVLDGRAYYDFWAEGHAFNYGGMHSLTVDLGALFGIDELLVWHHRDGGPVGHNVPADVLVEYFDGTAWRATSFGRQIASQEWAGPTGQAYGSLEDRYRFSATVPEPDVLGLALLACGMAAMTRVCSRPWAQRQIPLAEEPDEVA